MWVRSLGGEDLLEEGHGNPLQYSCLENPIDRGVWWAAVLRVAQSRTRLKRLSSSSSSHPKCFICPGRLAGRVGMAGSQMAPVVPCC